MEDQIRREGVWADDLTLPIVARVFFELPDGTYHPGMFVASLHDALRLVLEYGLTVPRAFITLHDEVILDVKEGGLEFPVDAKSLFDEAKARFPVWNTEWIERASLGKWTRSRCAKLTNAARAYAEASGFDGSLPDAFEHPVNRLEHEVQSVAAQFGLDLYQFGYQVPGVVCAELERFDAGHSHSGNGISSMDQEWRSDEKRRSGAVVIEGAQEGSQFESQSTPVDESLRSDRADGDPENGSAPRPPIARIWWGIFLVVLLLMGSPWRPGDLDESISRVFMVIMFGSMVAGATILYWALSAMFPRRSGNVSYGDEIEEDDEFDLQNWRNGRVPRYMDETDPASGPLWIGNGLHEQVMKDQADRKAL